MNKLAILLTLLLSVSSAFAAFIDFKSMENGQIRVTGTGFTRSATNNKQVNIYKNDSYVTKISLNSNGSFSYTTTRNLLENDDRFTVKVLQYYSNKKHFERTSSYFFKKKEDGNVTMEDLSNGQIRIVGKGFTDAHTNDDQVNFYKNGDFFKSIFLNSNGSFSYTTPKNTFKYSDKLTVKVLQYYGHGEHAIFKGIYKFKKIDSTYKAACYKNTSTYTNERLCLNLRVPSRVSYACGNYTGTYSNETTCLKTKTNPETTKACSKYMGTYTNEAACLKTKNLSPSSIKNCSLTTWSYSSELRCIQYSN
jgi:hypothetical protein